MRAIDRFRSFWSAEPIGHVDRFNMYLPEKIIHASIGTLIITLMFLFLLLTSPLWFLPMILYRSVIVKRFHDNYTDQGDITEGSDS